MGLFSDFFMEPMLTPALLCQLLLSVLSLPGMLKIVARALNGPCTTHPLHIGEIGCFVIVVITIIKTVLQEPSHVAFSYVRSG